jgi:uncharacterized protein YegJ (DUF2314 family)
MNTQKYTLTNGIESNKAYPNTFWIPSDEDKDLLDIGDACKLIFEPDNEEQLTERMWVNIIEINGDEFVGELDNNPVSLNMKPGDLVKFHRDAIVDICFEDKTL